MSTPHSAAPPVSNSGDGVLVTVASVLDTAKSIQKEIAGDMPPEWVAARGPTVPDVKTGMLYAHRAWNALVEAVIKRSRPEVIAALMIEVSGTLMKVGMDVSA